MHGAFIVVLSILHFLELPIADCSISSISNRDIPMLNFCRLSAQLNFVAFILQLIRA